jgi:hypothetical protein
MCQWNPSLATGCWCKWWGLDTVLTWLLRCMVGVDLNVPEQAGREFDNSKRSDADRPILFIRLAGG